MAIETSTMIGRVFIGATTGIKYGIFREASSAAPIGVRSIWWSTLAEDESGNFLLRSRAGRIGFWDHETGRVTVLAKDVDSFLKALSLPTEVELQPEQVQSAWIDPKLAKQQGLDVPDDGWVKRTE